jgi:hypothetical protein
LEQNPRQIRPEIWNMLWLVVSVLPIQGKIETFRE